MVNTFSEKIFNCFFGHEKTLDANVSETEIAGIYDSLSKTYDILGSYPTFDRKDLAIDFLL